MLNGKRLDVFVDVLGRTVRNYFSTLLRPFLFLEVTC